MMSYCSQASDRASMRLLLLKGLEFHDGVN